jgi:HEPN domain
MAAWTKGADVVRRLLAAGELQSVRGGQADGTPWLDRARRTVGAAEAVVGADPDSACTLAYDAARFACMALLAQQGLRPTTRGGHLALDESVRAQFGDTFRPFRALRIRRNELEYPAYPGEQADADEARAAIGAAHQIIQASDKLLPYLGFFDHPA